jgi:alcohol dehydrogenase YqhD (iron-dependent ADH family)
MKIVSPPRVILGSKSLGFAGEELGKINAQNVLIICGGFHRRNPEALKLLCDSLEVSALVYHIYHSVDPNTNWEQASRIIEFAKERQVDTVLAIGGGSVIDMAKAVAFGVPSKIDVFDFYERNETVTSALKIVAVPTMIGTGSEGSDGGVLTKHGRKLSYGSEFGIPLSAILDPDLLTSLNNESILCGLGDAMSHVLERYFCKREGQIMDLGDEFLLVIFKTLIKHVRKISIECRDPIDLDLEELMWVCHIAHNGYLCIGKRGDWATHTIAHELETISDCKHGHAVGLIFPYWIDEIYAQRMAMCDRLTDAIGPDLELFEPVDCSALKSETAVLVQRLFRACGAPKTLREIGIESGSIEPIVRAATATTKSGTIGNLEWLDQTQVRDILHKAIGE